jgi:hypothetical protein
LCTRKIGEAFDTLVILTAWLLSKKRNARVFGNAWQQCTIPHLVRIKDEFILWKMARPGGRLPVTRE